MATTAKIPGSSYKNALNAVTTVKLNELKIQKTKLDAHYEQILQNAEGCPDLLKKLEVLYEGIKNAPVLQQESAILLDNVAILIRQASSDPSTSSHFLRYWIERLMNEITCVQKRSEYAYLYGRIISDWVKSENELTDNHRRMEVDQEESLDEEISAKLETEQHLRDMIFEPANIEPSNIKDFLANEIFNCDTKEDKKFMETFIEDIGKFGNELCDRTVSEQTIKYTIDGLLKTDLLPPEHQIMLQEVRENSIILREFASVLNVMLRNVTSWHWPEEGIPIELRRGINGKYRAFMVEDVITALFLQYIGAEWCVFLKQKFVRLFDSNLWRKPDIFHKKTIIGHRQMLQRTTFLLSSLPDTIEAQAKNAYNEGQENEVCGKISQGKNTSDVKSALDIKHDLLHLINVEARLHQTLKPNQGFTVVRSDFEWFGPSIPHEVILTFLEFLGVPKLWINFFNQYLKTPVLLPSDNILRTRRRGVPISHLLSTVFAEVVLFGLDLYINRTTDIFLYRIHDDIWFWDSDGSQVEMAWNNIKKFADIMGLRLNQEKSGSVTIFSQEKLNAITTSFVSESDLPSRKNDLNNNTPAIYYGQGSLPQDTVKWGFIVLHSDGAFHIDQSSMAKYVEEMEDRLIVSSSIIEWVNTYNKYMAFFLRNFGKFANVFGTQHADQIIEALKMIECTIFRQHSGSALAHLSAIIKERIPAFKDSIIPDAWMYWPITSGGLGLNNPFIGILALRKTLESSKYADGFSHLPEKDAQIYNKQKAAYEKTRGPIYCYGDASDNEDEGWISSESVHSNEHLFASILVEERNQDGDKVKRVLSFDEYCEGRESRLAHWSSLYQELLSSTSLDEPTMSAEMSENFYQLTYRMDDVDYAGTMDVYWRWVVCHYADQLLNMFGSLHFVNAELVPMGLISILKTRKVKFDE